MSWSMPLCRPAAKAMLAGATPKEITSARESSSRPIGEASWRQRATRPSSRSKHPATGTRRAATYTRERSWVANPFVERVIGSIRRECLDHCLILNEAHLRRLLRGYLGYYKTARPHQSLDNNSPKPRVVEPPPCGRI